MTFDRSDENETYLRVEKFLDPIMVFLSILFLPLLLGPMLTDMSPQSVDAFTLAGGAIWVAFFLEYAALFWLASDRKKMLSTHKLDLLIVLVPFLRPLGFLKLLRLATVGSSAGRALKTLDRIGGRPGLRPYAMVTTATIIVGAALTLAFEYERPGSNINDFGDALWWAIVTCTTVGYGDHSPVTGGGQVVAVVLMLVGIAGLGLLTASIAAAFVDDDDDAHEAMLAVLKGQLDRMESQLDELSRRTV